jgi:hypothetical protein
MYLRQDPSQVRSNHKSGTNTAGLQTWGESTTPPSLRGRKQYWHRDPDYPEPPNANKAVQLTYAPAPEGTRFGFTVHVDGISQAELGGLLMALDLPDGHAHKLGGGKAFGQGSVRVTVDSINLQNDRVRYTSLTGRLDDTCRVDTDAARETFMAAVAAKANFPADRFEAQDEIAALRTMMDFDGRPGKKATASMELKAYRKKPILKTPQEIAQGG